MFFCSEYNEVTMQCLNWVDASAVFSVESGVGLKFGLMLFGLAAVAWCLRMVAMLILNR